MPNFLGHLRNQIRWVQLLEAMNSKAMFIFGTFWREQKFRGNFLPESQTRWPYASNKPSYIKFRPFLGALSTKNGKKPYNVTTCNVFLTKKGSKRPKRDFWGEIRNRHFRRIGKPQLCAKNHNNPMIGFLDLFRTDGRTYGRELINYFIILGPEMAKNLPTMKS